MKSLRSRIIIPFLLMMLMPSLSMANNIDLSINMYEGVVERNSSANQIVGIGHLNYSGSGRILVSVAGDKVAGSQSTYIIRGRYNPKNTVVVRLGGDGWYDDDKGIISKTTNTHKFNIYSISENVNPDVYMITINATELIDTP